MSPLGQRISNWLASGPGLICGDSFEAMWHAAFFASGLTNTGVSQDDFAAALDRAGYRVQQRTKFIDGKPEGVVFVLALPERIMGI